MLIVHCDRCQAIVYTKGLADEGAEIKTDGVFIPMQGRHISWYEQGDLHAIGLREVFGTHNMDGGYWLCSKCFESFRKWFKGETLSKGGIE